ncbi:MAG TPA: RNA polymerase sigma-70 factor [Chloroflexia bacterium]|nr:RNA polymerase sigma-70 factor [Chloroflexia bacterium]
MNHLDEFNQQRPLLFSIAYRMLGSVMDAEDMLQEAFLRWNSVDGQEIQSPKAYLSTLVTRLCLDQLKSARARREVYVGPWLPEPLVGDAALDVTDKAEMLDSVSTAFMLLLENLSPLERAVFLLREVFDYDYAEIAQIVDKSEANCRQMVRRARQHLQERRPRFNASTEQQERLTARFIQATASGDIQGLVSLLTDDIVLYSDGGGKVHAARNPIYGNDKVARFIVGVARKAPPGFTARLLPSADGQLSMVGYAEGKAFIVINYELDESGRIKTIYMVVNPDKFQGVPDLKD